MKTINKNWLWAIGGLMLLNITLLAFIWIKKPTAHKPPAFLEEKLSFSEQQKQQFENLRNQHRLKIEATKNEIDKLKDELYVSFPKKDISVNETAAIAKKMGEKKAEIDLLTFQHFRELREICTPKQQKILDETISEIVNGISSGTMPPQAPENNDMPPPPDGQFPEGIPPPPPPR